MSRASMERKVRQINKVSAMDAFMVGIQATIDDLTSHGYVNRYHPDELYCVIAEGNGGTHVNIKGNRIFQDINCEIAVIYPDFMLEEGYDPIQVVGDVIRQDEFIDDTNLMYFFILHKEIFDKYK